MPDPIETTPYDRIPYPTGAIVHSHPDRLATMATLFGMSPAPLTACRVLEIACGNGNNLIPMAHLLGGSEFVGLDLAATPISQGRAAISELGLQNISLHHRDLQTVGTSLGRFDYIIAHGIFSWVPPVVREGILQLCRNLLSPQGVALISYNTQPGGHIRSVVRDMMLFHTQNITDPMERAEQARALIRFVAEARQGGDEFRHLMHAELERIRQLDPNYLIHDDLSEWNTPYYFSEFMATAARHGLQFLAEADPFEMQDAQLPDETRVNLGKLGSNRLLREQYLDFVKCRRFRLTLLCHADVPLTPEPDPGAVAKLQIASRALKVGQEERLDPEVAIRFESPRGPALDSGFPVGKAALSELIAAWPERFPFDLLVERTRARLAGAGIGTPEKSDLERVLAQFLLQIHGVGLADLHMFAPAIAKSGGEQPMVDPLARWQAARGDHVTTRRHDLIRLNDPLVAKLVTLLDGTRGVPALVDELERFLRTSTAFPDKPPAYASRDALEEDVRRNLATFARAGLFVPADAPAKLPIEPAAGG